MQDSELVQQILKGEQSAVSLFYRRYQAKLLEFIQLKTRPAVAEEILQDTFISALQSLPLFKAQSSLESWLFGIAKHEIADYYRRQKIKEIVFSKLPFLSKLISQALSPEVALEEAELKRKIKKTFARLSEGKRRLLRLRYVEGWSVTKIAAKLKISYKSCESRLTRARLAFREEFVGQTQKNYQSRFIAGSA
jgi:RNA polymerase sigma-70 factor (ECF subfamily)